MVITDKYGKIIILNKHGLRLLHIENKAPTDFIGSTVGSYFYNDPQ
jgi:uncharacterized protein (DUF2164 family)